MYQKVLPLFLVLFSLNIAYAKSDAGIETQIKNIIDNENLVGLSWATISKDHVEVGSTGYANISKLELMKPEQKMHVGSVTKSVLAMGVLHLIFEGKLSLESNVESLLSTLNFDNDWHLRSPIKVKNLLDHTAGLDNIRIWQLLSVKPSPNIPLKEAFPSDSHHLLKVRTEPGTQYSYSNMGYTLLAMVIEAVTNQRYEAFLDNNFLAPLGMHDSSFAFISQEGQFADPLLAMGYHENNIAQIAVPGYLRPAGQFTTTAADMANFIKFLLYEGKVDGKSFINPEHMKRLTTPLNTKAHLAGLSIGHGLAFANRDRHNVLGMCHPGTTFGFRAYICLFPDEKKGFFYAINTDNETADYEKFNKLFINTLSISTAPILEPTGKKSALSSLKGIYLLSPNNMAEFEFIDMLFNFIWLEQSNEQLLMKSLQSADKRLIQINENLFRDVNRRQASHVVYANDESRLFISDGLKTFEKVSGITLLLYWASLLFGFIGLFYLFIVGLIRIVKRDKDGLGRIKWVFINLLLFSLPIYLYINQSFLKFGDITAASICLAFLSGCLPIALLLSLWISLRRKMQSKLIKADIALLIMSLQFCLVLFAWGYIPTMFWQ
ncbi:serine hydrolase [Colwellia sp. Bg11-12]|uniref:serine hydrolase domain-containing protein n=1 Tax=Colwellia sp. Bg11-12 TaxID=2759817 RepID=UPI0015F3FBC0|nr:serine hydrolase domain-containing protein [Colwellia sp. Bg11-12]MBA6263784.1 beta-lactamase family protein [Colwellia sp. Bg11-12]